MLAVVMPQLVWGLTPAGKDSIKAGNILHCFDWQFSQIQAELDNIKAAGFYTVQTSVAQKNYGGQQDWNAIYRPWDTSIGNGLGTQAKLTALCTAAHAKGMYIIVDVVANHTDGQGDGPVPYSGMVSFWTNTDLYHNNGGANDGSRYQVTHGHIGMPDLKTEDSRVQQKYAAYVQTLKGCGVDGIRWDAAKHIGLPSEGDAFWTAVLDQSMYNYGEILNTTGGDHNQCINEYQSCGLSVTDNNYSTNMCLGAFKNGNVPSGNESWRSGSSHKEMFVYWGESHDTYLNDGDASQGVDQNVVDRAYALAAAHKGIPGLYLSRPNLPAKVGVKGSTHFTSSEVKEVNKMKNACAGQSEYYVNQNGVGALLRQSGAVIVKGSGSGQISINNGGSTLAVGTYTDHVSGGTFTVTSSTISGSIGSTGIAVLYGASSVTPTPDPDPEPTPDPEPEPEPGTGYTVYFDNTDNWSNVYCYVWDANTNNKAAWPGTQLTETTGDCDYFVYTCDSEAYSNIIFNNGGSNKTNDLTVSNGMVYTKSGCTNQTLAAYEAANCGGQGGGGEHGGGSQSGGSGTGNGLCLASADEVSVWFQLPDAWDRDGVGICGGGAGLSNSQETPMTRVADRVYKYTFTQSGNPGWIQFKNSKSDPYYQIQVNFTPNGYYIGSSLNSATLDHTIEELCSGVTTELEQPVATPAEPSARKLIINGQLVIIRDGVLYNAVGIRL